MDYRAEQYFIEGVNFADTGQFSKALASFDKVIAIDSDDLSTWFFRGNVLFKANQFNEALNSYDRAITISPDFYPAWDNRGWTLINLGQYAEAINSYDRVIALRPEYTDPWYWRGGALSILGKYSGAIGLYNKVIEITPDDLPMGADQEILLDPSTCSNTRCTECKKYIDHIDPKLEMKHHGQNIQFCSFKCRTLFVEKNFKSMLQSDLVTHHTERVYFGDYPDPNDLKTHGDINNWTDQKYE